jgi:hypothetical protein
LINILELCLNLAFTFPTVISSRSYVICALVVEMAACMIASIKLNKHQPQSIQTIHDTHIVMEEGKQMIQNVIVHLPFKNTCFFMDFMTNRILMIVISCLIVFIAWLYPHYEYGIICTCVPLYLCALLSKLELRRYFENKVQGLEHHQSDDCKLHRFEIVLALLMELIVSLFGWLTVTTVIPTAAGVAINLCVTVVVSIYIVIQSYLLQIRLDGMVMSCMFIASMIAIHVVYLLFRGTGVEHNGMLTTICFTLSSAMIMLCTNVLKSDKKRGAVRNQVPSFRSSER